MKLPAFLLLLAFTALAPAQTEDPLAPIKSAVKNHTKPFTLIVEFKLKPGALKTVRPIIQEGVKNTRKEPGCGGYETHLEAATDTVVFVEKWRSMAALEEHVAKDYTKTLLGAMQEHGAEPMKARVLTPLIPPVGPGKGAAKPAPAAPKTEPAKPATN